MKKGMSFCLSIIVAGMFSGTVLAQDLEYHPALSDNFSIALGAFKSDNAFNISAAGRFEDVIEEKIDFHESVGVDKSSTLLRAQ